MRFGAFAIGGLVVASALLLGCGTEGEPGGAGSTPPCVIDYPCRDGVCPETRLDDFGGYGRVVAAEESFYFAEDQRISELSREGIRVIGEFPQTGTIRLSRLAIDATAIFANNGTGVSSMDRVTGEVRYLGDAAARDYVLSFGTFAAVQVQDGTLLGFPKGGGESVTLLPPGTLTWPPTVQGDALLYSNTAGDLVEWQDGLERVLVPHGVGLPDVGDPTPWVVEEVVASDARLLFRDQHHRLYVAARDGSGLTRVTEVRGGDTRLFAYGDVLGAADGVSSLSIWAEGASELIYYSPERDQPLTELALGPTSVAWVGGSQGCALVEAALP